MTKSIWAGDDSVSTGEDVELIDIEGYKPDKATSIPTMAKDKEVITLYYNKDATKTKNIEYTVKYMDVIANTSLGEVNKTVSVWVNDNTSVVAPTDFDQASDKFPNYQLTAPVTQNTTVTYGVNNTIVVGYTKEVAVSVEFYSVKDGAAVSDAKFPTITKLHVFRLRY